MTNRIVAGLGFGLVLTIAGATPASAGCSSTTSFRWGRQVCAGQAAQWQRPRGSAARQRLRQLDNGKVTDTKRDIAVGNNLYGLDIAPDGTWSMPEGTPSRRRAGISRCPPSTAPTRSEDCPFFCNAGKLELTFEECTAAHVIPIYHSGG